MKAQEFVNTYQSKFKEYCPCVIDIQGEIYMCDTSHLNTMIQLYGDDKILSGIPADASPLFYLMEKLRCVVVDYENQIYSGELSQEQRFALLILAENNIILMNQKSIKEYSAV